VVEVFCENLRRLSVLSLPVLAENVDSLGNTMLHKVVLIAKQGQVDSENTLRIVKALMNAGVNPCHRNNRMRLAEDEVASTNKALKRVSAALQDGRLQVQMRIESERQAKTEQKKEKRDCGSSV
jgi:capsule polysaccharide export protein KpsE/RkpR